MTKYLITTSLLGSFAWYLSDESDDSRKKFLQTLGRVKTPTTSSQQKGIDFENDIEAACQNNFCPEYKILRMSGNYDGSDGHIEYDNDEYDAYSKIVLELTNIVKDGLWQQSVKKDLNIGDNQFILYGRADVIKADTIYDIKYTSRYDVGKFQSSIQHLIYLYCTDLPNFSYLISNGRDWWREDYFNHSKVEGEIKSKITNFLDYLENDKEAEDIFFDKWQSKY